MITSSTYRSSAHRGERDGDTEMDVLRLNHDDDAEDDTDEEELSHSDVASTGELAGIYLGVLNVYTTIPQFVGTFISWIVFSIVEPGVGDAQKSQPAGEEASRTVKWMEADKDAPNAIGICLFIGAISALVAAEATRRLRYVGSGSV